MLIKFLKNLFFYSPERIVEIYVSTNSGAKWILISPPNVSNEELKEVLDATSEAIETNSWVILPNKWKVHPL